MNLGEIRVAVRRQTETTEDELPNATIDGFVLQAFQRTIAMENWWPFYESTWSLVLPAGESTLTGTPSEINWPAFQTFRDVESGHRLEMLDPAFADEWFGPGYAVSTTPGFFSVWGRDVSLWPKPTFDADREFFLRGYRLASQWLTGGSGDVPDCDERLHACFINYACALAYIQQEDIELENTYMMRWERDAMAARSAIMEPVHHRPLVMGTRPATRIGPGSHPIAHTGWRFAP